MSSVAPDHTLLCVSYQAVEPAAAASAPALRAVAEQLPLTELRAALPGDGGAVL